MGGGVSTATLRAVGDTADAQKKLEDLDKAFDEMRGGVESVNKPLQDQEQAVKRTAEAWAQYYEKQKPVVELTKEQYDALLKEQAAQDKANEAKARGATELGKLDQALGGTIGKIGSYGKSLFDALKANDGFSTAVIGVTGIINLATSAFSKMEAAVRENAAEGNEGSQILLGSFKLVDNSVTDLITSFTDGLGPAFAGLADIVVDNIDALADWMKNSGGAREIAIGVVEAILGMVQAYISLNNTVNDAAITMIKFQEYTSVLPSTRAHFAELREEYEKNIITNSTLENRLSSLLAQLKKNVQGDKEATEAAKSFGMERANLMEGLRKLLNAEGNTHEQRLKIIQDWKEKNHKALEEDTRFRTRVDMMIEQEENRHNTEMAKKQKDAIKDAKDAAKDFADVAVEQSELVRDQFKKFYKDQDDARKENLENLEDDYDRQLKAVEGEIESQSELEEKTREILEKMVNDHRLSVDDILDAKAKLMAMDKKAAKEMQKNEDETTKEQIKQAKKAQKETTETYKALFGGLAQMATDWKAGLSQIMNTATKSWIDAMQAQGQSTETVVQQVGDSQGVMVGKFKGATSSVVTSNISRMKSGVIGWAGSLGPFGLAIAEVLIQAFMGILMKQIGLARGGTVPGRPDGDREHPEVLLEGGEEVTPAGTASRPGVRQHLRNLRSGMDPGTAAERAGFGTAGGDSAGGGTMRIRVDYGRASQDRQLARMLMRLINVEVLDHAGRLVSSEWLED